MKASVFHSPLVFISLKWLRLLSAALLIVAITACNGDGTSSDPAEQQDGGTDSTSYHDGNHGGDGGTSDSGNDTNNGNDPTNNEPYCGDDTCDDGETCESCAADCGACTEEPSAEPDDPEVLPPQAPVCGDAVCEGNENCESCDADCDCVEVPDIEEDEPPLPTIVCGDSVCDESENCESCAADCGECAKACKSHHDCEHPMVCKKESCEATDGFCTAPKDALCGADYSPVCGCDGVTYSNACVAKKSYMETYRPGTCW